jgi:hypothetical protein
MKYEDIVKIPYDTLKNYSDEKIYAIVSVLIKHYREYGYPYFPLDEIKIKKEVTTLFNMDTSKLLLANGELQQTMVGLNTCNTFHPEMVLVKCKNSKSPMEIFTDDALFRIALTKRIKYNDRFINDSCVRRSTTAFGGRSVSNFRPSVAKWVYDKYGFNGCSVLDPCMGYGGRLMGAYCSSVSSYTGVDPNIVTLNGNAKLFYYLNKVFERNNFCFNSYNVPFEEYSVEEGKYDLVFTSPPYFNLEKYSDDDTQSCVRYKNYDDWVIGFLRPLIDKSFISLKNKRYFILNVGRPIDKDTFDIGNKYFKSKPKTYYMRLSKFLGQGDKSNISHKLEPIYVWYKK